MEKNYESNYAKGIRWQLIEDSIVKDNMDLVVKDEELRDFVAHQIFPGTDLNTLDENTKEQILKIADSYLKREDQQERLRNQMADVKMTRFLKEKMNIKYKETTYEAFLEQLKKDSPKPKTKKAK
jgi:trigger factor